MSDIFSKKFLPLLFSRFLSAINTNFMSVAFLFFVTYHLTQTATGFLIPALLLYALAFCVGSTFAGQWADKVSKKKFLCLCTLAELSVVILASVALTLDSKWLFVLIIGSMGAISACTRVGTYALIPDLVSDKKLVQGNAWLKALTFVGYGLAGLALSTTIKWELGWVMPCAVAGVLAVASFIITTRLPKDNAVDPGMQIVKNPIHIFDFLADTLRFQYDNWAYLVGIAWFWVISFMVLMVSSEYVQTFLHARWSVVMFISACIFPLGYVLGSTLSAYLSKKHSLGTQIVWVGIIISLALFDFVFATRALNNIVVDKDITIFRLLTEHGRYWRIIADVFVLGTAMAMYIISFYTLLQKATPKKLMGRMISFSGLLNALTVAGALVFVLLMRTLSFDVVDIVGLSAITNLGVTLYMVRLLPIKSRRSFFKFVLGKIFRVKVSGLENLKKVGSRALIVANHTSFMDVLLISTFIDKPIVFTINEKLMNKLLVKFMTSLVEVKPLDAQSPFAVKTMVNELKQDKLCMIFPQGLVNNAGNSRMKIYEGPAMMAMMGDAPVLPIRIDGACYTIFSRVVGTRCERRWFPKISITILPPVSFDYPEDMPTREKRERSSSRLYDIVQNMAFDSFDAERTVFEGIADGMKRVGRFKPVMDDTAHKPTKFWAVFLKAFVLGRLLNRAIPDEKYVGVAIPTSSGAALTVLGLHAFGKVPAMINFTSGAKSVVATCQTVGLKTVVTAHKVVQLAKLESLIEVMEKAGVRIVYLEDLKSTLKTSDKLLGIVGGFFPKFIYRKVKKQKSIKPSDSAVILFTSGSEGLPKAVFLTHQNILSNCHQVVCRFDFFTNDVLLNCLPVFHSFGLSAGLFLPLFMGLKVFLYPTPLHYRIIPEVAASCHATIFFATDTFLAGYAKCANPYDFNTLRVVAGGAEKIKEETYKIWQEKFGVRLFEGYGATECSPFISVNTFLHQKKGTVGRLLPGIEYKLKPVDGIKEGGELWIKGPNIMQGYMRHGKPLELDPPEDGWYDTGDIVDVDADGFIAIKGRCKRFAKIGGEMVSLLAVEQVICKEWPDFITGAVNIPDAKKGEQIVLITTCKDITKDKLLELFRKSGMPEIGLPSKVITTSEPPLLGTGKFDYVTAKELALAETAEK